MLCCGRVIGGLGVGIASAVIPLYQAEMAPRAARGRLVSLYQWAVGCGMLFQYLIQYGAARIKSQAAFRVPWGVQVVPALALLAALPYLPPPAPGGSRRRAATTRPSPSWRASAATQTTAACSPSTRRLGGRRGPARAVASVPSCGQAFSGASSRASVCRFGRRYVFDSRIQSTRVFLSF
ncbi:hypothetical protein GGR52DRAFT_516057 [Hypoxylon sp. FL1284]|nr:hypothetical protein GGR52DRAFT_516057 [Hypoxylon sp. FL1284]